ncbi:MAG: SDR family oxidoreductase [Deltaproteobacteria bacterium]|nr:SDR family oxidoreductase [Deltaproteobacteria bacterium]
MTTILVTGATGTIGANVVSELQKLGAKVRVATRDTSKAPKGTEAVDFAWDDAAKVAQAVAGVDAVFLLTPLVENSVPYVQTLVDAAKKAGVKKIVKLSAGGADNPSFDLLKRHTEGEQVVRDSGIAWVALRPNFFMTNFVAYYPPDAEGAIYLPTGEGKAAWMDPRDVAEVAALALTKPDWDNRALELSGPAALSVADVAQLLSTVSGRTIRHVDVPESAAKSAMEGMQLPGWMVEGMLGLHGVVKQGWAATPTTTVKDVTGHAPRTFEAFAKENASAWKK